MSKTLDVPDLLYLTAQSEYHAGIITEVLVTRGTIWSRMSQLCGDEFVNPRHLERHIAKYPDMRYSYMYLCYRVT